MPAKELSRYIKKNEESIEWVAGRVLDPSVSQEILVSVAPTPRIVHCLEEDIEHAVEEADVRRVMIQNWILSERKYLEYNELPEDPISNDVFSFPALSLAIHDPLFASTLQFALLLRQRAEQYHVGEQSTRVAVSVAAGVSLTRLAEIEATVKPKSPLYPIWNEIQQLEGGFAAAHHGALISIYNIFGTPEIRDYFLLRDWKLSFL